jgi:phage terminase small subunit
VTVERVVREYARIGFADIRRAVKWRSLITEVGEDEETGEPLTRAANEVALVSSDELDEDTALAIAEVAQTKDGALRVKLHSKLGALDSLARHLGMFNDRVTVNGTITVEALDAAALSADEDLARIAISGDPPPVH